MEACESISHVFFVLLALFVWKLDVISRAPCIWEPLAPVRCDSPRRFFGEILQFPREKWTPITLQFTLGNLEWFLRAVSASHRVRQSALLVEEFHNFFIVLVVPGSPRSSHLKIWTLASSRSPRW